MSKRGSGAPRHPRNPVAKAVRTPAFKLQVVPDKRWPSKLKQAEKNGATADATETTPESNNDDADHGQE